MTLARLRVSLFLLVGFQIIAASALCQTSEKISGKVMDSVTGEPLPGATVLLVGTSLGAATDLNGSFAIQNVPIGDYTVRTTYVGYESKEIQVQVRSGKPLLISIKLLPVAVQGKEVVVTAQASGQNAAINQQLSSMQVTNVVSAAKIQELPDANAAESVGRLPGVSLIREGGEGSQVVIRGLSPQYNQVTIDGVEMASDVASANNLTGTDLNDVTNSMMGDRGVDLSMISSNSLGGIEVIKAITPDMDAAVLGGVVNFDMRKATKSTNGLFPSFNLLGQGAYNQLKNTRNDYKFVASAENRYLNGNLGVFLEGSAERRNLSDNELGVSYTLNDKSHGDAGVPDLTSLTLQDVYRIRDRYNGTLVMDYNQGGTSVGLMNFLSTSDTKATYRNETAYIFNASRELNYGLTGADTKLNVMTNLLSVKTSIPLFQVDLRFSHSYSETQDPGDVTFNFVQDYGGFTGGIGQKVSKLPPNVIATYIQPNDSTAWLDNINNSSSLTKERIYQGKIDLEHDFNFSDLVTSKFKFGGVYQYRIRSYSYWQKSGSTIYDGGDAVVTAFRNVYPQLVTNSVGLSMANFVYDGYSYGNFLNGDYTIAYPLNDGLMWQLVPIALKNQASTVIGGGYKTNDLASRVNNYSGNEKRSAAYGMLTVNIGEKITLLPGIRYQNLTTTYTGGRSDQTIPGGVYGDTTVTESHGYFLPMAHLMYKPLDWFQVHFAYTNTLNYPDYSIITPRYLITNGYVSYNNYRLKPATSENFDLVLSAYSNVIGLFSVDGFSKRIKDLVFYSHTWVTSLSQFPELPQKKGNLWQLTTYINSPFPVNVYGVETDWQTHFWYLPGPLSGLILSVNYTHIFSQAHYPKTIYNVTYDENGNAITKINDTSYVDRLLNQPNDIVNLALGYDYKGFSIRASMLFQDNVFRQPSFWMQERVLSAGFTRWDVSVKQDLPWYGVQLYLNLNNISSANDVSINEKTSYPASEQRYGSEVQLGLRFKL
jgi:TonB-dependent receptor